MNGFLLDTNVISELRRPKPSARVVGFVRSQPLKSLHISSVTLSEIRFGIERLDDVVYRTELEEWLKLKVRPMFAGRVLPIDEDVMFRWRVLLEVARKSGRTCAQPDLIIAATAAHYGLTVVSRDVAEFGHAGVAILNPWVDRTA